MAAVTTERTPAPAAGAARPRRRGQAPVWRWVILAIAGLYFLLPPPVPAATGVSPAPRLGARSMVAKLLSLLCARILYVIRNVFAIMGRPVGAPGTRVMPRFPWDRRCQAAAARRRGQAHTSASRSRIRPA